jgi:hypothetical protein
MGEVAGKYIGVRDEGDREKNKKGELNSCVGFFKNFFKCLSKIVQSLKQYYAAKIS